MQQPRTLDDLLHDARITPDDDLDVRDADDRRDLENAFFQNAAHQHGAVWDGLPRPTQPPTPLNPWSRREHAARDLRTLSSWAIHDNRAAHHIAGLAATHQLEPASSMTYACLLYLAGCDDQAEFFWQFSAGADTPAAAECLTLLHLTRGELRTAHHWARQAANLDNLDTHTCCRAPQRPLSERLTSRMLLRTWRALRRAREEATPAAFRHVTGTLSSALTAAVRSLHPDTRDDLSWPNRAVADQLQQATA